MKYISIEYVRKLHSKMIAATGGSHGTRDIELLKSSIENFKSTFGGQELYPTIEDKCLSFSR